MQQRNKAIRSWMLARRPGHYDGPSSGECLAAALADYVRDTGDAACTVEDFAAVLWSVGLKPDQFRNAPATYRLALPSPSSGDTTRAHQVVAQERVR